MRLFYINIITLIMTRPDDSITLNHTQKYELIDRITFPEQRK